MFLVMYVLRICLTIITLPWDGGGFVSRGTRRSHGYDNKFHFPGGPDFLGQGPVEGLDELQTDEADLRFSLFSPKCECI